MKKFCSKTLNPNPLSPKFGFTLIELLVAISITGILFTLGIAQYMKFNRQQILDQTVLELKTNLTRARNMALAGKKTCTGGFDGIKVSFPDNTRYTLNASCNNQTVFEPIGEEHRLPEGVIKKSGIDNILFKSLTGGTNLENDQTITLTDAGGNTGGVQVTPSGKIE